MLDFPPWKTWGIFLTVLVGLVFAVPNFFPEEVVAKWPAFVPREQINLGLDLRGGSHILLEADTGDVAKQRLEVIEESVRSELRQGEGGRIHIGDVSTSGGRLSFMLREPSHEFGRAPCRERVVSTCRSRGLPEHYQKKTQPNQTKHHT